MRFEGLTFWMQAKIVKSSEQVLIHLQVLIEEKGWNAWNLNSSNT